MEEVIGLGRLHEASALQAAEEPVDFEFRHTGWPETGVLGQLVENVRERQRIGFPQEQDEEEKLLLDFRMKQEQSLFASG